MKIQNNKTKAYLIVGLSLVAILVSSSSLSSVIAQTIVNTPANNTPRDADDMMADIEKDIPGFGGAFIDANGVLNTYKVSSKASQTQTDTERSVYLENHLGKVRMIKGVINLEGKYTFSELLTYKNKLTPLINEQLNVTAVGIDKSKNLIMVGLETMNTANLVRKEISKLDVPQESVYMVETGKSMLTSHTGTYRPVIGGVQIQYFDGVSPYWCSVGIAADHATKGRVIVTAGHCSAAGARDHTTYYQNNWPSTMGTGISGTNPVTSRYSDSVLITPSVGTTRGVVHRDTGGDLTLNGKQYIDLVGDSISKSGKTTMDTSGVITNTCFNTSSTLYGTLYCQDYATYSLADGDSGGTVYGVDINSGTYKWYGVHWGVFTSGPYNGKAIFSTVHDIENDQGTLTIN